MTGAVTWSGLADTDRDALDALRTLSGIPQPVDTIADAVATGRVAQGERPIVDLLSLGRTLGHLARAGLVDDGVPANGHGRLYVLTAAGQQLLPPDRRAILLSHDATLDSLAIKLHRSTDARRRAALGREVAATHSSLRRALGAQPIEAGDLRR
jgi:hypothetical protein